MKLPGAGYLACGCASEEHSPVFIVITGGPGAGKTAILELARRVFCEHVTILPEAASIVFGGGFPRLDSTPARRAAQQAIFHVQRQLETWVAEERQAAIVLCDRGTLDGLAYWPGAHSGYFERLEVTRAQELARYRAVIHLRTPAAKGGYVNSALRIESAEEAAKIDQEIWQAWEGHPQRHEVVSEGDFSVKALGALEWVRSQLPECCRSHPISVAEEDE